MRIAILLHAHLRSFRKTAAGFKKKVVMPLTTRGHSVKIFIHTWDKEEFETKTWHEGAREFKKTNTNEIEQYYEPESFLCEKQEIFNAEKLIFGRQYEAIKAPWHSLYKAWKLMEGFEEDAKSIFDMVVVTRPDVYHYSEIFMEEVEDITCMWQTQVFTKKAASDVFLYGGREWVEKALIGFYHNFDKIYTPEKINSCNNNEVLFNSYVAAASRIKKSKYCMPLDWRLLRSSWPVDHRVGHRKWDRALAGPFIEKEERYKFFRRKNRK